MAPEAKNHSIFNIAKLSSTGGRIKLNPIDFSLWFNKILVRELIWTAPKFRGHIKAYNIIILMNRRPSTVMIGLLSLWRDTGSSLVKGI